MTQRLDWFDNPPGKGPSGVVEVAPTVTPPQEPAQTVAPSETPVERLNWFDNDPLKSRTGPISSAVGKGIDDFFRPLWRTPKIYGQETREGWDQLINGETKTDKLMGGLRYLFSPFTAPARAFAGEPFGEGAEAGALGVGASPETAKKAGKFVGDTAEIGVQMFTPGAWAKSIAQAGGDLQGVMRYLAGSGASRPQAFATPEVEKVVAGRTADAQEKLRQLAATPAAKVGDETPVHVDADAKGFVDRVGLGTQDDIFEGVGDDVILALENAVSTNARAPERLYKEVGLVLANALDNGQLGVENIQPILTQYGMTGDDFANAFMTTVSESGRTLQKLSVLARRIANELPMDPLKKADIERWADEPTNTLAGKIHKGWMGVENARRAMLVTQVATATRNALSQVGRLTVGTVDDMIQAAMNGSSAKESAMGAMRSGMRTIQAVKNQFPGLRKTIDNVLEGNPVAKGALYNRSVHEVEAVNKVIKAANYINTGQERFFRRLAFEARLRKNLDHLGLELDNVDPSRIPPKALNDAVKYALEMTFAADAKTPIVKQFISAWSKAGLTTVNPFPRFAFANALPFVLHHSPLGFAKALSPSTMAKLANGSPAEFNKAASRALLGTMFLGAAGEMRKSNPDLKWYQAEMNGKIYDLRAFAPFSTYLFVAEALNDIDRPEGEKRLLPADYGEAAVGLNRLGGSGLVILDALRAKDSQGAGDIGARALGEYLSGFTVALRTAKDLVGAVDEDEIIYRDKKSNSAIDNLVNPTVANVPFLSQTLPEGRVPLKSGTVKPVDVAGMPGGLARQVTGLTAREYNAAQREVARLGLNWSEYAPRTGVRYADRHVSNVMSQLVERAIPNLLDKPNYKNRTRKEQQLILSKVLSELRSEATKSVKKQRPDIAAQIEGKSTSKREAAVVQERTGTNVRDPKQMQTLFQNALR